MVLRAEDPPKVKCCIFFQVRCRLVFDVPGTFRRARVAVLCCVVATAQGILKLIVVVLTD